MAFCYNNRNTQQSQSLPPVSTSLHTHNLPEVTQLNLFFLQTRHQEVSWETCSESSWFASLYIGSPFFQTPLDRPSLPKALPYLPAVLLGSSWDELCLWGWSLSLSSTHYRFSSRSHPPQVVAPGPLPSNDTAVFYSMCKAHTDPV